MLANVGIRLKGMGSFRSIEEKPSLVVKFDEFATNQHYRSLNKLMFNNSVQDSTYLAELMATQLFRDAGLPAASRHSHARAIEWSQSRRQNTVEPRSPHRERPTRRENYTVSRSQESA